MQTIKRILELPDYILRDINEYCYKNDISVNAYINNAINKNISDDIDFIKISKKTTIVPTRIRILSNIYDKLKSCTSMRNISMQKLIIHCILIELYK